MKYYNCNTYPKAENKTNSETKKYVERKLHLLRHQTNVLELVKTVRYVARILEVSYPAAFWSRSDCSFRIA